ncbi:Lrp/AsnC family transcriptional regulator [Leifsonia sp. F6_8S_P_1B]|uniref:Lrp/AsnC family transcriptional regulator n=1 Tax=Leifsonia williamsii TaxID=3035919 RepID=A0ABT8KBX4_9MICO|nr:Lrp/AsnC family transcriptional regulator [Leifsonia williamsii]MDN4613844.1 Lrp/AsnC family transcriptional regulator [Leifsonia williamsii]
MDLDAALVRALQEDGRASVQTLAARLGQPRAAVSRRLRAMLADGTVRVIAAVDPAVLGQHVLAHVSIRTDGAVEPIAEQLRRLDETVLVSAVGGTHGIVTEVRLGSMAALHELLARIRALPGVAGISTLIYSAVVKGFFVSHLRAPVRIDATDASLVEELQRDGRQSLRALGETVRLSPSAVATRLDRLTGSGVITVRAVEARGLTRRQLSMGVGLTLTADDDAVLTALAAWPDVDFAARTIGRFDAVATLVQPSAGALHESLERIRSLPGVAGLETWLHLAVVKEDYTRTLRPVVTA